MAQNLAVLATAVLVLLIAKVSCNIFAKAGFPKLFGLLIFLPVVNLLVLYTLAFGDWPIFKDLRR